MIKRYKFSDGIGPDYLVEDPDGDFCEWKDVNAEYDIDGNIKKAWRMKQAQKLSEMAQKYQEYLLHDPRRAAYFTDVIAECALDLKNNHNRRGI